MKTDKNNKDMPVGEVKEVKDFLPPPEDLILPDEKIKVTILLNKKSIDAFKKLADQHHTQYQKLIRKLIDKYAQKHLSG